MYIQQLVCLCLCLFWLAASSVCVGWLLAAGQHKHMTHTSCCIQGVPGGMCQTSGECSLC